VDEAPELRRCGRCRQFKPTSEFGPKKKGGWQGYCRPCHTAWHQEYYQRHREAYIQRALRHKEKLRAILKAAKDGSCADCGRHFPPYVFDFDHREGEKKLFNVSALNHHRWVSVQQLETEIAKCDLVCSNCHRIRTHQRRCRKKAEGKSSTN